MYGAVFLFSNLPFFGFFAILFLMTPEEKDVLQKTYALSQENNQILLSMHKSAKRNMALRWVYWGIIILLTIVSFYFAGPFLSGLGVNSTQLQQLTGSN